MRPPPAEVAETGRAGDNGVGAHVGRWWDDVRAGDVGSLPIIVGLLLITIFFQTKNDNFLTAGNFSNLIVQMAGTTTIAMGVVFVLLLGEIDLSIGYVSGIAGVVVAELQTGGNWTALPGWVAIVSRCSRAPRSASSRARSSPSSACRRSSSRSPVLLALAGRDPEADRRDRRDRDPGQRRSSTSPTTSSPTPGGGSRRGR